MDNGDQQPKQIQKLKLSELIKIAHIVKTATAQTAKWSKKQDQTGPNSPNSPNRPNCLNRPNNENRRNKTDKTDPTDKIVTTSVVTFEVVNDKDSWYLRDLINWSDILCSKISFHQKGLSFNSRSTKSSYGLVTCHPSNTRDHLYPSYAAQYPGRRRIIEVLKTQTDHSA